MAAKEATIYLFDLGKSMGQKLPASNETALDLGLRYFRSRVADQIVTNRKTLFNGIVVSKRVEDEEDGNSIRGKVVLGLKNVQYGELDETIMGEIRASVDNERQIFTALYVALNEMEEFCGKRKYNKNIVVITDGNGPFVEPSGNIISELLKNAINLKVIGIGFKDSDEDINEVSQDASDQDKAEAEWRSICTQLREKDSTNTSIVVGTMELLQSLQLPFLKKTRPVKVAELSLSIGDAKTDGIQAFEIPVCIFPGTRKTTPQSATLVEGNGREKEYQQVRREMQYYRPNPEYVKQEDDEEEEDYKTPLEEDDRFTAVADQDVTTGYLYGHEIVPVNKDTELFSPTRLGFEVVGTVELELGQNGEPKPYRLDRWIPMSQVDYCIPNTTDEQLLVNFHARVMALKKDNMGYVARLGVKVNSDPRMVLLAPYEYEDEKGQNKSILTVIDLPMTQDDRPYVFPSLLHPKTKGGKDLASDTTTVPTEEMVELMAQIVDGMDLMEANIDDDGNKYEYAAPYEVFHPLDHRIKQVLKHKAVAPAKTLHDIPPKAPIQTKYQNPLPQQISEISEYLEKLNKLLELSEVEKITSLAAKRKAAEQDEQHKYKARKQDLDIDDLLSQ